MTRCWRLSVLLLLLGLEACSADPVRRHVWTTYERELVRLEAAGDYEGRVALVDRGLKDEHLAGDDRATLQVEAALSLAAMGRDDAATARLDDAEAKARSTLSRERVELTRLRLGWDQDRARRFLIQRPRAAAWGAVFEDWLRGIVAGQRREDLHQLLRDTSTHPPASRCLILYRYALSSLGEAPDMALECFDEVVSLDCARSVDAEHEAMAELARQLRWDELARRGEETQAPTVAWLACRLLEHARGHDVHGELGDHDERCEACLASFVERFPHSGKVDDAWWFQAEYRRAAGDMDAASALLQRIVDERPDSGRAARARRDLDELRGRARP